MASISATLIASLTPSQSGTPIELPYISEKAKGCGYYGQNDAMHTVQYTLGSFNGEIVMQGSLEALPTEDDWFDISDASITNQTVPGLSITTTKNFTGNFVWVRAVINQFSSGNINRVLFAHN